MKFYNREKELKNLKKIEQASRASAKMTIIVGRRRIGKTTLIKEAYPQKLYLFVSKKNEALLCEEFIKIVELQLEVKIFGEMKKFKELFEYIMELSTKRAFTLIIDEFQEFSKMLFFAFFVNFLKISHKFMFVYIKSDELWNVPGKGL